MKTKTKFLRRRTIMALSLFRRRKGISTRSYPHNYYPLLTGVLLKGASHSTKKYEVWEQFRGSNENIHNSSLSDIDTSNVKLLQPAWEFHTVDADSANLSL